jgi:hypothetical protein
VHFDGRDCRSKDVPIAPTGFEPVLTPPEGAVLGHYTTGLNEIDGVALALYMFHRACIEMFIAEAGIGRSMKYILLALLLMPAALAASGTYYLAVSENAPASDVVAAANLAAKIRAETDISFTGVTDRTMYDEFTPETVGANHIVLLNFDNERALYVVGTANHNAALIDVLEDEGFDVIALTADEPYAGRTASDQYPKGYVLQQDDFLIRSLHTPTVYTDTSKPAPIDPNVNPPEPLDTKPWAIADTPALNETNDTEEPAPLIAPPPQQEERKQPSAPVRFWHWLQGLFS